MSVLPPVVWAVKTGAATGVVSQTGEGVTSFHRLLPHHQRRST
ncbi:MAG: hypothetical protein OXG30_11755 [bacterium]|nr:hypothetical protein [bacterium]